MRIKELIANNCKLKKLTKQLNIEIRLVKKNMLLMDRTIRLEYYLEAKRELTRKRRENIRNFIMRKN
jgi:hypothetical protein